MKHPIIIDSKGQVSREISQSSWQKLAAAMAAPIYRNLDYQGIARKCLVVEPLPQGALPIYDRDIDVADIVCSPEDKLTSFKHNKIVISSRGDVGQRRLGSVFMPEFEVFSNPTVRISDVKQRRFSLIERTQR